MATSTRKKHSKLDPVHINIGLELLYPNADDPVSRTHGPTALEIIAIPGLGANPEWTWVREKVHWLRDSNMLARKVPNSRISVFQYQSQWFGKGSVDQKLENVANQLLYALDRSRGSENKTPIIFICHCLGGIVLEKALLTARLRQNDFPSVYPFVAGCIFLGTPFHGTKSQNKALILAEMAETIGMGVPSHLLKMLEKDSEMLRSLLEDFALLAKDAQIRLFCFFEQQKSDLASIFIKGLPFKSQELVVDEASATITAVEKLPLASDHFSLNKYTGPKDGNFVSVSNEIKITAQKAPGILKSRQNNLRQLLVSDRTYHSIIDTLGKGFQDVDVCVKGPYRTSKGVTPSWVLDVEHFKSWKAREAPQTLWVHGKAGTGQGTIATSVIDNLNHTRTQGSIIASFFCDQGDENRRTLRGLLKLLVRQIIDIDQDLAIHLLVDSKKARKAGMQDFDAESLSKVAVLWDALQAMAADLPGGSIYIVVHGLEQLTKESLNEFLELLKEYHALSSAQGDEVPPIKWMLLSRSGRPDIDKGLKARALEINTDSSENRALISDTLRADISGLVDELQLPAPLAYFVKRFIHARAEDNYIYVNLAIQEVKNAQISGMKEHSEIRKLLESFPYGLTDMFEHIRKRILDPKVEGIEYTKEILRCLIIAEVAPTMRELAIMADLPVTHRDDLEKLKEYVVRCGAFLTLRGNDWDEDNNTIEWIDISAREHLEKYAKDDLVLSLNDMQHGIISLRCLSYLYDCIDRGTSSPTVGNDPDEDELDDEEEQPLDLSEQVNDEEQHSDKPPERSATTQKAEANDDDEDEDEDENNEETDESEIEDEDDENEEDEKVDGQSERVVNDMDSESDYENNADEQNENEQNEDAFSTALKYPLLYWINHAKLAPVDVLEEFRTGHTFWQDYSEPRQSWWRLMQSMHTLPDQTDVSALHVAVIAGFPALVDHLLNHGWTADIHAEDSLGFQPLYYACSGGEDEILEIVLGAGADINFVSDTGNMAALHAAASNGHRDIVESLLDRDADINATSDQRGTALYAAAENNHMEVMHLLIDRGADVNVLGGAARRALNIAAYVGNVEGVKLLIENGADTDPDEDYWYGSALGAAARHGHVDVVKLLLSKGWKHDKPMNTYGSFITAAATYNHLNVVELLATKETRIPDLENALQAAAQRGYSRVVEILLRKTPTLRHQKAFHLAAYYGRNNVLKLLFPRGIPQDKLDEALFHATDNEHERTVNLLLEFGADPNAEGPIYGCALTASAYDGTEGILQALLDKGADVNKRGGEYGTAIQAAAFFGAADNVRTLIEHGATLNTEPIGIYGNELQAAVYTGDEDTVRLLLEHGADINAQGGKYGYPIIAAVSESDSSVLHILLENKADVKVHGGENNSPVITIAAGNLQKADLEAILDKGADINAVCDEGTTALISCADSNDAEGLQFLIDRGANVHVMSEKYGTALHVAAAEGDEESCEVLLKAGADVNATGGWSGSALQAACYSDDMDCVELLLNAGAEIDQISGDYGTPLQAAAIAGATKIVSKLLEQGAVVNPKPPNGEWGCALSAAASWGNAKIVRMLLKHKADVNFEGGLDGFPILAAAGAGELKIAKLLLDHGAVVTSKGGELGSAAAAAAWGDELEVLELLIDRGADVHATGGKYGSAIQAAAVGSSMEIIDYLLSKNVDINHTGGKYHTALIAASYFNRLDLVTKLLILGADVTLQGGKFRNVVTAAAIRGNRAVLETFLEMEPPKQMLDEALVEACAHRQSTCVDALLKAGANIYARHPTLGLASDAMKAEQVDGYNSDDESQNGDDEEEDSDEENDGDEDDEEESEEEDESDEDDSEDGTATEQTAEGSVTDLQLEDNISEDNKIEKLLQEAMERVKRNASVKRSKTVKRTSQVPSPSNPDPSPQIPPETSVQQFNPPAHEDDQLQKSTQSEPDEPHEDLVEEQPAPKQVAEKESNEAIQPPVPPPERRSPSLSPPHVISSTGTSQISLPSTNSAQIQASVQSERHSSPRQPVREDHGVEQKPPQSQSLVEPQAAPLLQQRRSPSPSVSPGPPLSSDPSPQRVDSPPTTDVQNAPKSSSPAYAPASISSQPDLSSLPSSSQPLPHSEAKPEVLPAVSKPQQQMQRTNTPTISLPANRGSSPAASPGLPARMSSPQRFSTKVPSRKPLRSPGLSPGLPGTYQLQQQSPGNSRPSSSQGNYTPPAMGQHLTQPPIDRQSSPSQYQAYSSPPAAQSSNYIAYNQGSQASSRTSSIRGSQHTTSTQQGVNQEYTPYRTSNSSSTSISGNQNQGQGQEKKWSTGGYDGEGYG